MKKVIKIELERAFGGAGFKLALAVGLLICIEYFIRIVVPIAAEPLKFYEYESSVGMPASAFQYWIGVCRSFENELFVRITPLLAAVPYAVTYCTDIKSGIIKNYCIRTKKINYLFSKYLAVFLTGGAATAIPLFISLLATAAVLPSLAWPTGVFYINANGMWSDIFFLHPYLYITMYMCLQFVCSGFLATLALAVSSVVSNIFAALLAPYILCEFLNAFTRLFTVAWAKGLAPYRLLNMSQLTPNYAACYVIFIAVSLIIGILVYFVKGVRDEIF